jgi:hypothetical protein
MASKRKSVSTGALDLTTTSTRKRPKEQPEYRSESLCCMRVKTQAVPDRVFSVLSVVPVFLRSQIRG